MQAKVRTAAGKPKLFSDFHKLFQLDPRAGVYIVAPDLHPETDCREEAERWRWAIRERAPGARLCLVIWETESWLLADPEAVRRALGVSVRVPNPEATTGEKPSRLLESECKRVGGYRGGSAFDKGSDGVKIVEAMDLQAARRRAPSLDRFLTLIGAPAE